MTDGREDRPALDRWFERVFDDAESSRLGSGWLSGTVSVFLGALGLLAVLVLWFPEWLTTARFRALYPLPLVRGLIQGVIAAGFVTGCLSMLLRRRKVLGLTGGALSVLAALLGGGGVALPDSLEPRPTLGLDWFVLNLFLLALLFVPLERFFPRLPAQSTFRLGWTTDTLALLREPRAGPGLLVPDPAARGRGRALPRARGARGRGPRAAARRAVPGRDPGRRPRAVRRAPRLPPGPAALALPRRPPLEPRHGLAGRLAAARGGRRRDARPRARPAAPRGLRASPRSTPTSSSSRSTRSSSTPTCASRSARSRACW